MSATTIPNGQAGVDDVLKRFLRDVNNRNASTTTSNGSGVRRRAAAYIAGAENASEGGRNNAAFNLAGNVAAIVDDNGETPDEAFIIEHMRIWNKDNTPPLTDAELVRAIQSGMHNGTPRAPKPNRPMPAHDDNVGTSWQRQGQAGESTGPDEAQDVDDPEILSIAHQTLPDLSADVLPPWAAEHVREVADALEVPVAMPMLLTMSALAFTSQGAYALKVEGSYVEQLAFYAAPVMESGERKSATVAHVFDPVYEFQKMLADRAAEERRRAAVDRQLAEEELKNLKRQYLGATDGRDELLQEIHEKTEALPPIPTTPQRIVEDFTEAALGIALHENRESLLAVSSEGGMFDSMSGRHKDVSEIDLFLKANCGDSHTINRVGRDNLLLRNPLLSVGITPQPGVVSKLADKPGFIDRGLVARFAWAIPRSRVGSRTLDVKAISPSTANTYSRSLQRLARDAWEHDGPPTMLTLTDGAWQIWKDFQRSLEPRMGRGGDLYEIKPWASKLAGLVARMAAICHIAESVGQVQINPVSEHRMEQAIRLGKSLIPHAHAAMQLMGQGGSVVAAKVVEHYDDTGWPSETLSHTQWWRPVRKIVKQSRDFDPVAEMLVDHGYLIEMPSPRNSRGGPTGRWWRANRKLVRR